MNCWADSSQNNFVLILTKNNPCTILLLGKRRENWNLDFYNGERNRIYRSVLCNPDTVCLLQWDPYSKKKCVPKWEILFKYDVLWLGKAVLAKKKLFWGCPGWSRTPPGPPNHPKVLTFVFFVRFWWNLVCKSILGRFEGKWSEILIWGVLSPLYHPRLTTPTTQKC